ncbi:MAG TPA: AAA family ATPase [Solirubrobacteraceae bacterium]|nr:AAA family ATPase [Solirubrobacteraceae bacterium]
MAVQQVRDRRGRAARGKAGLLDRDLTLHAISDALESVGADAGQAILVAGHPGMGKTRLYEAAIDEGRARGFRVLHAAGSELEQTLAFGVAGQLMRALLSGTSKARRTTMLADAPRRLRFLDGSEAGANPEDAGDDLAVAHGLFSLLATASDKQPALICIDDLHWCDPASLKLVLYLLNRLNELPAAMVITRRRGVRDEVADALDEISAHPRVSIQPLSPLSAEAVRELVSRMLGRSADEALAETCRDATAGNPFYLHELLLGLREESELAGPQLEERVRSLAPDTVTRSLRVRVGRLGPDAAALARAVASLGDDVPVRHAAALSGLTITAASAAADALASVEVLLGREPLRFVHPMVRQAIERDIPASELASRHVEAARLLHREGADAERVAAHLLRGRAENDPWAVEQLRAAAWEASSRGAPQSAARYLGRALAEPPPAELRSAVLTELGRAEATLGLPEAVEHLTTAADLEPQPERRAHLALLRGRALHAQGRHEEAAAAFDAGLRELASSDGPDGALYDELQSGFLATGWLVPWLQSQSIKRSAEQRERALKGPRTPGQRLLLAQAAVHAAFDGEPAAEVSELAGRGWENGLLLDQETSEGVGWNLISTALCLAGELEQAVAVADAALADARLRGSPLAFASASFVRALPQLWRGQVTDALADLELARDARRFGWRQFTRSAAAYYCLCLIETGDVQRAETVLSEEAPLTQPYDLEDAVRLYALAELRLAQGQTEAALEVALRAGETAEHTVKFVGFCPWRTCAAQAALALGERQRAIVLATEAWERAQRTGVLHQRIRTQYVLGMCRDGGAGLDLIRAAAALGESSPPRLHSVRALIELGAALRRANERSAARQPLQQAADLARQGGAVALYERARLELSASGARPRREALRSGPESLTPSERRIAELAAAGHSNREIAGALFITPKTVEYHLRNAYRKLGIQSRRELARALDG